MVWIAWRMQLEDGALFSSALQVTGCVYAQHALG